MCWGTDCRMWIADGMDVDIAFKGLKPICKTEIFRVSVEHGDSESIIGQFLYFVFRIGISTIYLMSCSKI